MNKRKLRLLGRNGLCKKAKTSSPWSENTGLESDSVTDVASALEHMKTLFPSVELRHRFPPIVFKHQLYTLLPNRTDVDKELNSIQTNGKIKIFQLGHDTEQIIIIMTSDFVSHVKKYHGIPDEGDVKLTTEQQVVSRFLSQIVPNVTELSIDEKTLIKEKGFKDNEVTSLMNAGLLAVRDCGNWWFSIPGAGHFMKMFNKGRQATLKMIRTTKYKELLVSELRQRKSPSSVKLGLLYHIHDLAGSDMVKCVSSSSGTILRLVDD